MLSLSGELTCGGNLVVTRAKYCISLRRPCQGIEPLRPMPMLRVAATMSVNSCCDIFRWVCLWHRFLSLTRRLDGKAKRNSRGSSLRPVDVWNNFVSDNPITISRVRHYQVEILHVATLIKSRLSNSAIAKLMRSNITRFIRSNSVSVGGSKRHPSLLLASSHANKGGAHLWLHAKYISSYLFLSTNCMCTFCLTQLQ